MLLWGDKLRNKGVSSDKQRVHFAPLYHQFFSSERSNYILKRNYRSFTVTSLGITLPLPVSTEVSTTAITRSWRLEFLQHFLTDRLELVWALEGIRSKHTSYSPFISDPRAGEAGRRLPHAPSFYLAFTGSTPIDHWYVGAPALKTEWKQKDFQPVSNLKSKCWLFLKSLAHELSSLWTGVHHRTDWQAPAQTTQQA